MELHIREYRQLAGYTQGQVAEVIGVARSTYATWETGSREVNLSDAVRLAEMFHCSLDALVGHGRDVLTTEEQRLVDCYRRTDSRGRSTIMAVAESQRGDFGVRAGSEELIG